MKDPFIRLNKLLQERGICSRREADRLIAAGAVSVNGEIISTLGAQVPLDAEICLSPCEERALQEQQTFLLHKPIGFLSGPPEKGYPSAHSLLLPAQQVGEEPLTPLDSAQRAALNIAGRLDQDSTGLLILTQSGRIAKELIHPTHPIEKEYLVQVTGKITSDKIFLLREGLSLDGRRLRRAGVERVDRHTLRFCLREGRKRQIRRMCQKVGLEVHSLCRIRIGRVWLGELPLGHWRLLRENELF